MAKNLLIVESPSKAKTIEKILGKDFTVKSSMGHVRDLSKKDDAVDVDNDFKPKYVVTSDKKKVVKELKDWVKKVDEVWLATDEDREGEAISWHLCKVLGLDEQNTKRIVFREITKPAVLKAVQNPRTVDLNLVGAQQARRILDRLVGFELSELLWKKIKGKLSAGRVQSVAVKLLVQREREIQKFNTTPFFRINAIFMVENAQGKLSPLRAELPSRFETLGDARDFLEKCIGADFTIENIDVKPGRKSPAAPFTTSTLQQEASRKMGFSVSRTMRTAQRLYESGLITYMRTDSTSLSEVALAHISSEIEKQYGTEYVKLRRYKTKKSNAQEAHEAIRPSYIERQQVSSDRDQQRLYDLIRKRTMASQMSDARLEKTTATIGISTITGKKLQAIGEVLKFDGFLKVYLESRDEEEEEEAKGILPPLKVGQMLNLEEMTSTERFTRPLGRFTEASLVKALEEKGIGRPSTYAPTISKIMEENRGYVVKESRDGELRKFQVLTLKEGKINGEEQSETTGAFKNRLLPTDMGMVVSDFLDEHFKKIMDYSFTADIEKQFDNIADGERGWTEMLKEFYWPFHEIVQETLETSGRAMGERVLGIDPESGRTVLVRMSRYGKPVVQIGKPDELEEGEKPKYANLQHGQSMETVSFEEVFDLFQLPKELGMFEDKQVIVGIGRYGPYVQHNEQFVSLPKGEDPLAVSLERSIELIQEKRKADAPIGTYKGHPISKGKGRFGPFLKWNKLFVNIPKKFDPETITLEEAHELIEAKQEKEANRYIHQWKEEGIAVENGRWGPFIRFKKNNIKLPKNEEGKKMTSEDAKELTLESVKKIILEEIPGAFGKKKPKSNKKG